MTRIARSDFAARGSIVAPPARATSSGAFQGPDLRTSEGGITVATVEQDARLSAEEHARQYALATNGLFQTRMTTPEPKATLHGLFLGALHVTFGDVSPRVTRRTTALCDRDRFDGIALQWSRSGAWHGRVGRRSVAGEAGALMLFDLSRPFSLINEGDRSFVIVMVPRALCSRLVNDPVALHGWGIDDAEGAILTGFLSGLIALRWSRLFGQFGDRVKLGHGFRQAASLSATPTPYASSGVRPPKIE